MSLSAEVTLLNPSLMNNYKMNDNKDDSMNVQRSMSKEAVN